MSIRMAASCGHARQLSVVPRGARTGRAPAAGEPAMSAETMATPRRARRQDPAGRDAGPGTGSPAPGHHHPPRWAAGRERVITRAVLLGGERLVRARGARLTAPLLEAGALL